MKKALKALMILVGFGLIILWIIANDLILPWLLFHEVPEPAVVAMCVGAPLTGAGLVIHALLPQD